MLAHLIAALKPASHLGRLENFAQRHAGRNHCRMAPLQAYRQMRFVQCRTIMPLAASQLRYGRETLIQPLSHVGQMFLLSSLQIEQKLLDQRITV
jgi:hypothetical protein